MISDQNFMTESSIATLLHPFLIALVSTNILCYIAGVFPATARPFIG